MARTKSKSLRAKKRGKHRERRRKRVVVEPTRLDQDAPLGTYHVDEIACELLSSGRVAGAIDTQEFTKRIRQAVSGAAQCALDSGRNQFDYSERRKIKRFFNDLGVACTRFG
jgi:hypothetical protein